MTAREKAAIESTAQAILNAREPFLKNGWNLAKLYNPVTMPRELLAAHAANDAAVDAAYGIRRQATEAERVQFLFRMHQWILENAAITQQAQP